jgi:hypothetical protein
MAGHSLRDEIRYRCRYPADYALANDVDHPRTVYVRETEITAELDHWLATVFDPEHLDDTCALLAAAVDDPLQTDSAGIEAARRQLVDCDTRLDRYRAALDNGADPQIVAAWIADVQGSRLMAERTLQAATPAQPIDPHELHELITQLGDLAGVLQNSDPDQKARLYENLGIQLIYRPADRIVSVEATPMCATARVGGPSTAESDWRLRLWTDTM